MPDRKKPPKPRNLLHRDMVLSGAFKRRAIEDKKKKEKTQRRSHRQIEKDHLTDD